MQRTVPPTLLTQDQADAMVHASPYADMIEDYELTPLGHSYTLENGHGLLVSGPSGMLLIDLEGNETDVWVPT